MEIRQKFVVDKPLQTVWAALCDLRLVASCVPGAEIVSVSPEGREVEGRIRTKLGPISAAFSGKGIITRDDAIHSGKVEGAGADKNSASRVKISLDYAAKPSDGGLSTTTDIVANVVLTGPLAQFGKGALMNDIATAMTVEFTKNLKAAIGKPDDAAPASDSGQASPRAAPAELRPIKIVWAVIQARFRALFAR